MEWAASRKMLSTSIREVALPPTLEHLITVTVRAKLKRTEQAITDYRAQIDTRKAENYGFASMAAVPYAHNVAHMLRRKRPKGTVVVLAPNPKDIVSNSTLGGHVCTWHSDHPTLYYSYDPSLTTPLSSGRICLSRLR